MVHCVVSASFSVVLRFTPLFIKVSSYIARAPQCSTEGFCIGQEEEDTQVAADFVVVGKNENSIYWS